VIFFYFLSLEKSEQKKRIERVNNIELSGYINVQANPRVSRQFVSISNLFVVFDFSNNL